MESNNLYVPILGVNLSTGKNLALGYAFSRLLGGVIWLAKILNLGETEKHLSNKGSMLI